MYKDKAKNRKPYEKERYTNFKRELSCADCGISFKETPYLCDFHHTDKDIKEDNPAYLKGSWKRFLEEVKKCIPLCANCHRIRHHKQD